MQINIEKSLICEDNSQYQKSLQPIDFNGYRKALCYESIGSQRDHSLITISLRQTKTTTNTGKTQQFNTKVQEEPVDSKNIISFSTIPLFMPSYNFLQRQKGNFNCVIACDTT